MIEVPWTDEQVANLNEYQGAGYMHPYTCPGCGGDLVATTDGWVCPRDDYRQRWARGFTADREWLDSMQMMVGRLRAGRFAEED